MTVIKVAAGVVLGLAVAWGCVAGLGYARKQLAVYQCVAATGRDSARVYEILGCMALKTVSVLKADAAPGSMAARWPHLHCLQNLHCTTNG